MKPKFFILPLLLAVAFPARAKILLSTDFSDVPLGPLPTGATAQTATSIINPAGAPHERMTAFIQNSVVTGTNKIEVVEYEPGKKALEFTDNHPVGGANNRCYVKANFAALSNTAKGNNFVEGRFELTVLTNSTSKAKPEGGTYGNPEFFIILNDVEDVNGGNSSISLNMRGTGQVTWRDGGANIGGPNLLLGIPHRFDFYCDLSRTESAETIWGFKVTRLSDNVVVLDKPKLGYARKTTGTPDRFVFLSSGSDLVYIPEPYMRVTNIHIEARNKIRPTLFMVR